MVIKLQRTSTHEQPLFDLLAGVASKDYPGTSIHKGDTLNTPAALQACLPLALLLYSKPIQVEHYYTGLACELAKLSTLFSGHERYFEVCMLRLTFVKPVI